jgi:hypothetical protein
VEGIWMINTIKSDYEHLLPSPLLPKWTTLECRSYTAPSTKEASREVVHSTGIDITQCQRWRTKTTNSRAMLCKRPHQDSRLFLNTTRPKKN